MSSRISFRIVPHFFRPNVNVVQILFDGEVCASIYPDQDREKSIKLVSAHFAGELTHHNQFPKGIEMDTGESVAPPIPVVQITFDPRPYNVGLHTIIRQK
ncbi:MAG: hypothetical protein A3I19_01245 [Candidatus Zambryskibacteria bacterium RIFCSPLOWO2_02_FULL_38_13]|nr:MAG: hypothetical protein A3I19_01245 [Candidatus Zambryskibacteria bacterium RIFCSPLOWO2_02_FULL_38_13]